MPLVIHRRQPTEPAIAIRFANSSSFGEGRERCEMGFLRSLIERAKAAKVRREQQQQQQNETGRAA